VAKKRLKKENREALQGILADPDTPADVQIKILQTLVGQSEGSTFFETMFRELLSYAECPNCQHETHWAIPEKELNRMGFVSTERDKRVPRTTTKADCPEYGQACIKKKLSV